MTSDRKTYRRELNRRRRSAPCLDFEAQDRRFLAKPTYERELRGGAMDASEWAISKIRS